VTVADTPRNLPASEEPGTWMQTALWLVGATMAYNVVEAVVALWAGTEASSIALLGFGLDSIIECAAATALLWRLGVEAAVRSPEVIETTERRVHQFIGATFLALAVYVLLQAVWTLWSQEAPTRGHVGIILASLSLLIMPAISWGKLHVARKIGSPALAAEARETLACSYLSFTLLSASPPRGCRMVVGRSPRCCAHDSLAHQGRSRGTSRQRR